jgi:RHS repeat-associated protein
MAAVMVLILLAITTNAQTNINLEGTEAPSVSDGVDVFSGKLEQILPLLSAMGRGEVKQGLYLPLRNFQWKVAETNSVQSDDRVYKYYRIDQAFYGMGPSRGGYARVGRLEVETKFTGWFLFETPSVTEVRFTTNSGTIIHFRDVLTNGQPYDSRSRGCIPSGIQPPPDPPEACSRGRVFRATDGSNATFVADADIYEFSAHDNVSGTLFMNNGTRIRIENNLNNISRVTDRNGNYMKFEYITEQGYTYFYLRKITDSLNREITIVYGDTSQASFYDEIIYKGFGGAERRIRINYTGVENVMLPGQSLGIALFPGVTTRCYMLSSGGQCDPTSGGPSGPHHAASIVVPASIVLPNGKQYQFYYNNYLEVARITRPTGSYIDYSYSGLIEAGADGFTPPVFSGGGEIYRRVSAIKNFDETGQFVNEKTFSNIPQLVSQSHPSYPIVDNVTINISDSSGTVLSKSRHYFSDSALNVGLYTFLPMRYGKKHKSEILDSVSGAVLSRTETTWQQRAPFPWCGGGDVFGFYVCDTVNDPNSGPPVDPRITEVKTTLETGQVTRKTFDYDQYNNVTDASDYDFGAGTAGPLLRRTHTDYVTAGSYTGPAVHLLGLPSQTSVYDSNDVERGRTSFEYDNYSTDINHAGLTNRAGISGLDAAFTISYPTRGNLTASTKYLLTNNTVTGSITNYAHYDIAGNVIKVIDGKGFTTTFDFTDHLGVPNGNVHSNLSPIELASVGQASYGFASSATNSMGHTSFMKFDYHTSRPVDTEDANGIVSSAYSNNEPLDRLTKTIQAVNTSAQNQTSVSYDDTSRIITTSSDLNTNTDGVLVSQVISDSFGRTIETRQYEGGSNYISMKQQYDALGHVNRTSNPYRPWQSEIAVWTTNEFDALGRLISVTTPDNAVVSNYYNGNQVLVKDQANKERMSQTNALGQLSDVWEITAADDATEAITFPNRPEVTAGYRTKYEYDTLGNIITVTQRKGTAGTIQTRTFAYDSLSRLLNALNPESGTINYEYDNNSNLTRKTDAGGISIDYAYDALNRNTTADYSNTTIGSPNIPDITRVYDSATNGKGRLRENYAGGNEFVGTNVEHIKIHGYDPLGRPLDQRQRFKTGGVWSAEYKTGRTYNLGGAVATQTYPSLNTVSYNYDSAGRLADKDAQNLAFTGNLGGAARTYSKGISYSPLGGMTREQFGTDVSLYHKLLYNTRGQVFDIRLSSVNDTWDWNRGRLISFYTSSHVWGASGPGNNGNVLFSENWIPPANATLDQAEFLIEDSYTYDALNRLSGVSESSLNIAEGGSWTPQFAQRYLYDRYGNRRIDTNPLQTWGGVNNLGFEVEAGTNRLYALGDLALAEASRRMQYDPAGNLKKDTYTGAGDRVYDAENRMTKAWGGNGGNNQWQEYTYNADGQRVRRKANGVETWQVYGMDGELLAEYAPNAPAATPQKEYGYRNGQLLITATVTAPGWGPQPVIHDNPLEINVTTIQARHVTELRAAIDALRSHHTLPPYPWSSSATTSDRINANPIIEMRIALDTALSPPAGGYSAGLALNQPIMKVHIQELRDRVLAAWNSGAGGVEIRWLVADHLGTPRTIIDQTGSLTGVKRHDYLPFGEELIAGQGGRTEPRGYSGDNVRQKFTSYERDTETELDYAQARYHSSKQGRFTSPDPFNGSMAILNPQSMNRYGYVENNPLIFTDPSGLSIIEHGFQFEFWGSRVENLPGFGTNWGSYIALSEQQYETAMFKTVSDAIARESTASNSTSSGSQHQSFNIFAIPFWGYFDDQGILTWWYGFNYRLPAESVGSANEVAPQAGFSPENGAMSGGLNPRFHPLPWRLPFTPKTLPGNPLLPVNGPAPPPPGFDMKWRLDPGRGVRLVPEYNPNYAYRSSYWAQNLLRGMMTISRGLASVANAAGRVVTGPTFIYRCQQNPHCGSSYDPNEMQ